MNVPSHRPNLPTNNLTNTPAIQLKPHPPLTIVNNVDSDEDYLDDYIMNDTDSQDSEGSDDDYFVSTTVEKFDKDRGATFGEIASLPVSKVLKKI